MTGHGFTTGDAVTLSTTGGAPGGLSVGPTYYVIAVDANNFKLATSALNASGNIAIDITSNGTGTQTLTGSGSAAGMRVFLGNGDGTFGTGVGTNLGTTPTKMSLGDINGDGIADIHITLTGFYALSASDFIL